MFVSAGAVYAWGWLSQTWSLGRVLPLLVLAGHLALALEVARWRRSSTITTAVVVACVLGAVGSAAGLARGVPQALQPDALRARSTAVQLSELQPLADQIGATDVVAASRIFSERLPAITGLTYRALPTPGCQIWSRGTGPTRRCSALRPPPSFAFSCAWTTTWTLRCWAPRSQWLAAWSLARSSGC